VKKAYKDISKTFSILKIFLIVLIVFHLAILYQHSLIFTGVLAVISSFYLLYDFKANKGNIKFQKDSELTNNSANCPNYILKINLLTDFSDIGQLIYYLSNISIYSKWNDLLRIETQNNGNISYNYTLDESKYQIKDLRRFHFCDQPKKKSFILQSSTNRIMSYISCF